MSKLHNYSTISQHRTHDNCSHSIIIEQLADLDGKFIGIIFILCNHSCEHTQSDLLALTLFSHKSSKIWYTNQIMEEYESGYGERNHDNGLNKMDSIENFHRNSLHACQKGNRFLTQIFEAVIPIKYDDDDDVIRFQWNRFIRLINVMIGSLELMDFRGFCTRFSIRWINQYWNIISRKKQRKTGNHKMKFNDFFQLILEDLM